MREWSTGGMIIGRAKLKKSKNLPQCIFVLNKLNMACSGNFDALESK
jgi:hypothetical protein